MYSAEVILRGKVITYSCAANSIKEFVDIVKRKVAAKYPNCVEGLMIRKVVKS